MKVGTAELVCDCGHETKFDYGKPGTFMPLVREVTCEVCRSRFEFRFTTVPSGDVKFEGPILRHPSRRLMEILSKKEAEKRLRAPEKKAPRIFLPN